MFSRLHRAKVANGIASGVYRSTLVYNWKYALGTKLQNLYARTAAAEWERLRVYHVPNDQKP